MNRLPQDGDVTPNKRFVASSEKLRLLAKKSLLAAGLIQDIDYFRRAPSLLDSGLRRVDANSMISQAITEYRPLMAARLGRGEVRFLSKILLRRGLGASEVLLHRWLEGSDLIWAGKDSWFRRSLGASIPRANKLLDLYLGAMRNTDLLGSWSPGETIFASHLEGSFLDTLASLEPFRHEVPWSKELAGRKVLVVHPFARTIRGQYQHVRHHLFGDKNVLPDFDLLTLTPFMEGIRNPAAGQDLVSQFEQVRDEMLAEDFDVTLIGAGPMGFLLASEAKKHGRIAVHLGGATQLLFGIRGRRWDRAETADLFYNEFWVRPAGDETPESFGGAYDNGDYW